MTTVASAVIGKARLDLNDPIVAPATDGVRWLNADLLGYLNDGQALIAKLKPDASIITGEISLVAGCKQALPAGGIAPIRFGKNVTGGTVPSKALPETLDVVIPDWQNHTASATVKVIGYNPTNPTVFYTYPPQPTSTSQKIEAAYLAIPAVVAAVSSNITLPDDYVPALIDYMLHRAYGKDSEIGSDGVLSQTHYNQFLHKLGVKPFQQNQKA